MVSSLFLSPVFTAEIGTLLNPCQFPVFAAISAVMMSNHKLVSIWTPSQRARDRKRETEYSKFITCSAAALHLQPSHCWYKRWVEWGHIRKSATCPEPCANTVSVVVSNDGDEQTGTQAETGLIRFVAHMIKCYIHSQIMVAAIERKISLKKKN